MKEISHLKWTNTCYDGKTPYETCYKNIYWRYQNIISTRDLEIKNYQKQLLENCCNCSENCQSDCECSNIDWSFK